MNRRRRATTRTAVGAALLLVAGGLALADRLHLASGGVIETDSWSLEGDQIVYFGAAGKVGLPRSVVVRIEPTASAPAAAPRTLPRPTALPEPADSPGSARVERESAASAALARRDFEGAGQIYKAILRDTPLGSAPAAVGYAVSQMALGRDDLALGAVLDGLTWNPGQPLLLELLGDLRNREEHVDQALGAWREAFAAAPTDRVREKVLKAERELHAGRDYDRTSASHFNLRFDGELDRDLAHAVTEHLERQYWVLAEALDHAPSQPITVVLYPTQAFRDVTQSAEWVGGVYDGKIRVPLGGLRHLDPVTTGVLTHELTHAFVHSKTHGQCPRWLHEGLAQHFEGKTLRRTELLQVTELARSADPATWEQDGFSYPAALSLVQFLGSDGDLHRLVDVLEVLGAGRSIEDALTEVYGKSYSDLCRDWAASLAKLHR